MNTRTQFTPAEWRVLCGAVADRQAITIAREVALDAVRPVDTTARRFDTAESVEGWPDEALQDYAESYADRHRKRAPVWLPFAWILGALAWLLILCVCVLLWGPEP